MTDLSRLTEALASHDRLEAMVAERYPGYQPAEPAIVEAARLVVDGQDVSWCETHEGVFNEHEGACIEWLANPGLDGDCRMVPARLIFPKQGGSDMRLSEPTP